MSFMSKYTTCTERDAQYKLANIRCAMRRCDRNRTDWKKRQELQRRAMFIMSQFPKYEPMVKWWL